jgi:hypothetical protein
MKKFLLVAVLILSGASISRLFAGQQQNIPMQIIRTGSMGNSGTYAPPRPWYIQQDDYVLTLPVLAEDYTFELLDQDDEVVYTTFLPSGTTQIILPSTLSGSYEIRLVGDTYYYRDFRWANRSVNYS